MSKTPSPDHPNSYLEEFAQAFSQNDSLFKKLVELAPMGVTLSSSERTLDYANRAFAHIIGYSQDELVGLDWKRITYEEDQGKNLDLYNELLTGKIASFNFEKRYHHKKGHLIWCKLMVSILPDEKGNLLTIAFIEDITTEKENYHILSQQAAMIQAGEAVSKMGTIVWNIQTNNTEASPGIYAIYELDPELTCPEDLFTQVMSLTHPEDVDLLRADIERSASEKVLIPTDYRIKFPDGRIKWLKTSPGGFLDDKRMLRTIQDVSEEHRKNDLVKEQTDMIRLGEDLAKTGTVIWDIKTREIEASPGLFSIYELDSAKSNKKNLVSQMFGRIHPEDVDLVDENMQMMAKEKVQKNMSYRLQFPDGRIKWVKTGSGKFLDNRRKLAIVQDITVEKEKSLILERHSETIRLGEYVAKTGTFIWNIFTRETEVSPGFMTITELDPETSNSKNYFQKTLEKIHPDDLPEVIEKINRVVDEKVKLEFEFRLTFPDGRIKWIKTSPGEFLDNNRKLGILQDVTREKNRNELLEKQAGMIRLGEKVAKTGTALLDIDTLETQVSPGLYSIFELDPEMTNSQNLYSQAMGLIHPEDLPSVKEKAELLFKDRVLEDMEYRIQMPDGRIKWIKGVSGDFIDDKKIIGIVHDITSLKEKTLKLTDTNKEMEQLLYTVSHDLRAPLRHVSSYAQMVKDKSAHKLDEIENKYLGNVIQASARLGGMIDELLQYFRNRNVAINKSALNLNDIINSTKELFTQDTLDRGIVWEVGTIPAVDADAAMMEKVFLNLLSNAVKFTAKTPKPIIHISGEKVGNLVVVKISDNGAGFKMKYVDKIFAVFQRLHKRSDFEGTGIGLSNVQRIILRHGGNIWAEGEVDKGATFYFTLPAV